MNLAILPTFVLMLVSSGYSVINIAELSLQPIYQQKFIERPQNLTVIEGESVTLRCKIGNLGGKVQWSTNGFAIGYKLETMKEICSKCAPRGNTHKGEFHLYVEDVELGQYNEFECQVSPDHSNSHQALRAKALLNVIVPPSRVELVNTERTISMNVGTEKQLSCRASGAKPQAKIVWYHGNKKILDQKYSKQITNGYREGTWDTVNTIKFKATSDDDSTRIRCIVEHPALKNKVMEKEIALTVFYPPGEPRIVGDTYQAFREGDMINTTCISSGGNPPPYVSWFKDNIQLQYPHSKLENGSTVSHLYIRADQSLLTDVYNCKAWNRETSIALPSKNVRFNVTFKPEIQKFPRYAKFAQNLLHQSNLECIAYGYPNVSIFWKKPRDLNGERYILDNRNVVTKQWEPGFDGGFQQHFETKIKEVKTGNVAILRTEHSQVDRDTMFVVQDITIKPDVEYAFSVKAVNVYGASDFSVERLIGLKGPGRCCDWPSCYDERTQLCLDSCLSIWSHCPKKLFLFTCYSQNMSPYGSLPLQCFPDAAPHIEEAEERGLSGSTKEVREAIHKILNVKHCHQRTGVCRPVDEGITII